MIQLHLHSDRKHPRRLILSYQIFQQVSYLLKSGRLLVCMFYGDSLSQSRARESKPQSSEQFKPLMEVQIL